MESAYQSIYFILHPYFIQKKYVPHTNNLYPPEDSAPPLEGKTHCLRNSAIASRFSDWVIQAW
jgi:hypothetical protein